MTKNGKILFRNLKKIRNSFSSVDGYFLPFSDEFFENVVKNEDVSEKLSDKLANNKLSHNGGTSTKTIKFNLDDDRIGIITRIEGKEINQY